MTELWGLTLSTQARGVREGAFSAEELMRSVLDRIAQTNSQVNAFCTLNEHALAEARAADKALAEGTATGLLHGVPFSVKDLLPTAGLRTTLGSTAYANWIPDHDDVSVERMRTAGALLVGKTNTRELGYGIVTDNELFGPTRNPRKLGCTAGGSSGGSAAAVASGMGSISLGSDGGGSLRVPAALCGVFTLKPTFGAVPLYPSCRLPTKAGLGSWETLESVGPITRTVEDAALVLETIAGFDQRDRHSMPTDLRGLRAGLDDGVSGLRIAWSPRLGQADVDPELLELTTRAVNALDQAGLGCEIATVDPPIGDLHELRKVFATTVARDSDLAGLRELAGRYKVSEDIQDLVGRDWTAEAFAWAAMRRQLLYDVIRSFMTDWDLLITPTTATAAFPIGLREPEQTVAHDWSPFAFLFNLTGQPAASVPIGTTTDGRPVGLQIVGRRLADATVLRAARAFELLGMNGPNV
ncbi:aspartyl-tRNA(Asn)/glutamyl-tRNA(Gln) amidotransferase subunit A [Streptacidiphilus sp. MAP12-16]|uniref:amidase n=1 Tax=Streptacidiphilus sp. MAP12-16 TaxID=3156300 RepID=UPI003516624F